MQIFPETGDYKASAYDVTPSTNMAAYSELIDSESDLSTFNIFGE